MSGPKRNPDKLNTIGVVVVGICGAVLVYVSIVALQAFYLNDTSEIQTMADYGGQDTTFKSLRSAQLTAIGQTKPNTLDPKNPKQTFQIPIDHAMKLVIRDAKADPSNLVPAIGPATKATLDVPPVGPDGRLPRTMAAPAAGSGSAAGSADAGSAGSAAPAGSAAGSATGTTTSPSPTPTPGTTVTPTPTGGTGPGGGTAPQPKAATESPTPKGATSPDPKGAIPTDTKGSAAKPAGGGAKPAGAGSAAKGNGR